MQTKKIIIAITGASGAVYGTRLLQVLNKVNIETHLVLSQSGQKTIKLETPYGISDLKALAHYFYDPENIEAPISSGSFKTSGMIIAPCSMRTLGEIANGVTTTLITRSADVVLKERRRLVLMTRETPLNAIHIKNMLSVTEAGGIIAPPLATFYNKPKNIDDIINNSIGRVLDLFDIETPCVKRWK